MSDALSPGFLVLHSHRLENLRDVLVHWLRAHPLAPLENEVVLVQSNGMAQWLKAALAADPDPADPLQASGLGICAGLEVVFPARFLWQAMRVVLGRDGVPATSPFDKGPLRWRLLRLLPELCRQPDFAPLQRFLSEDVEGRRQDQLAERLADLYDQYQVYRADWLNDWSAGRDVLRDGRGQSVDIAERDRWQPLLWRALEADVRASGEPVIHRAALQARFVQTLREASRPPAGLPRRIVVWGMSTLPQPVLEGLAALGRHVQVILAVVNPCEHYWTDLLQLRPSRHPVRAGMALPLPETLQAEQANPLLLAWGQQGRDYLSLLAEHDDAEACLARFRAIGQRIDVFDEPREPDTLLTQLQAGIRTLEPPPATPSQRRPVRPDDRSLRFQVTHSRLREVEALHDHLLGLFAGQGVSGPPLRPQDVVVMVPDIRDYAPLIRAVFRQQPETTLPFDILDRPARGDLPLLAALEWLLRLPEARCTLAEVWDFLDVPAMRRAAGLEADQLPLLQRWCEAAGARWGLDAVHREAWGVPSGLPQNTWRFALDRLLLGYASGQGEAFAGIWPHGELSALEAEVLGPFAQWLDRLTAWTARLRATRDVAGWTTELRALLDDFLLADSSDERWLVEQLGRALADWSAEAAQAPADLSLAVVREAWLGRLDEAGMSQRFLSGAIPIATLMPMRAIPFRVVCILGLNDGDFPRQRPAVDFDLMALNGQRRAGDRSRRDDDRYLFLEAVLSAREQLYLSRVGRSARQNVPLPPSLLVAQLQDALARGWHAEDLPPEQDVTGEQLLAQLTDEHPLQPFSPRYFLPDSRLRTHAASWRAALDTLAPAPAGTVTPVVREHPLDLATLARFLRNPVAAFYREQLGVTGLDRHEALPDHEPFVLDGLTRHGLRQRLMDALAASAEPDALGEVLARQQGSGQWPLAGFAARERQQLEAEADAIWQHAGDWLASAPLPAVSAAFTTVVNGVEVALGDVVSGLRQDASGQPVLWHFTASRVRDAQGQLSRLHALLLPWLQQLLLALDGRPMVCRVLTPEGVVTLPPPVAPAPHGRAILSAWMEGSRRPLPFELKTGLAWVMAERAGKSGDDLAAKIYEGSEQQAGAGTEPPLSWAHADYDALSASGEFAELAQALLAPWVHALVPAAAVKEDVDGR